MVIYIKWRRLVEFIREQRARHRASRLTVCPA